MKRKKVTECSFTKRWGSVTRKDFQRLVNKTRTLVIRNWGHRTKVCVTYYGQIPVAETSLGRYEGIIYVQHRHAVCEKSNWHGKVSQDRFNDRAFITVEFIHPHPAVGGHDVRLVMEFKGTLERSVVFSHIPLSFFYFRKLMKLFSVWSFSYTDKALNNHSPFNPVEFQQSITPAA
jgi:hypothetical protein